MSQPPPDDSDLSQDSPNADPIAEAQSLEPAAPSQHDPYAALRFPNFRHYLTGQAVALLGGQMMAVAVAWELYQRTNSATALGLVGLVQIIPVFILFLPAGHVADRFNRRNIVIFCQLLQALAALTVGLASLYRTSIPALTPLTYANAGLDAMARAFGETGCRFVDPNIPVLFFVLLINGVVRSFNQPAKSSLLPQLVPTESFSNAVTWNSSTFEICSVTGPLLAGGIIGAFEYLRPNSPWSYATVYFIDAACAAAQLFFFLAITLQYAPRARQPVTLRSLLAGIRFVYASKIIFGALTLDMIAVLLGGATALLPIFARDILHVGPIGLGALRAAPSIGAFSMAMFIAHRPPIQHAGRALLTSVAGFGAATIIFGVSHNFFLSLAALFLTGVFDNVSVVVRHSLVQILTPDSMRGRVGAVNAVFISSSNELGAFESGYTTALGKYFFGTIGAGAIFSVLLGGTGTILVVLAVAALFPQVRRIASLSDLKPEEESDKSKE